MKIFSDCVISHKITGSPKNMTNEQVKFELQLLINLLGPINDATGLRIFFSNFVLTNHFPGNGWGERNL